MGLNLTCTIPLTIMMAIMLNVYVIRQIGARYEYYDNEMTYHGTVAKFVVWVLEMGTGIVSLAFFDALAFFVLVVLIKLI